MKDTDKVLTERPTDNGKKIPVPDDSTCVICGSIVPEGRLVCPRCEAEVMEGSLPR